jgi:uncharacterized protein (TIGR01777 family)
MKVAVSGSSGFIGTALRKRLEQKGHEVVRILRTGSNAAADRGTVLWDFDKPEELARRLEGVDGVVHLAGAGISDHRWTAAFKQEILDSRVDGTASLSKALSAMKTKPRVLVSGSAIGIYGPRGDEPVDESSELGGDFLATVCRKWEEAAEPARKAGIRVVNIRTGLVLDASGGALTKMLMPFRLGLGGIMGSGKQFYSWITLEDHLSAILHLMDLPEASGPYDLTAPGACTNLEFTKALGKALHRPTVFPMPAFAARLAFGEMADALLLSGQNVKPSRLLKLGFRFRAETMTEAFHHIFGS